MTVADLVGNPSLDSHLLSGEQGLDRTVLWAHSCELSHPERWLGPHELLMTIGLCIPQGAQAQREFIAALDEAGLAGIAVGEHGLAPRLTNAMLAESDARGFPILATHPDTPFAAFGRTVAAANADSQTMGVLLLAKLYQIAGQRDAASRRSGADLGDLFGTRLTVFDEATGCILIGEGLLAPSVPRAHSLRTQRPSLFFVEEDSALDGFALLHLAQVLAVDVNTIIQEAMGRIREGAAAVELALNGRKEGQAALLEAWGGTGGAFRAVVTACDVALRVPLALALAGIPPTLTESADRIVLAVPVHELERVRTILGQLGTTSGVSAEHGDVADLSGAVAEAMSEYHNAQARQEPWREFSGKQVSLLARSRTEAEQIIASVLGPLASDEPRSVSLRETLFTYLDSDMRWNVTADELHLHRQSLVYRLDQVEAITNRSVRRTKDLSEFWLARSAWKLLHSSD